MVTLRCRNNHTYIIDIEASSYPKSCDHEQSDRVSGTCIQCAMQAPARDPNPRCSDCGAMPSRIIDSPPVKIRIVRG